MLPSVTNAIPLEAICHLTLVYAGFAKHMCTCLERPLPPRPVLRRGSNLSLLVSTHLDWFVCCFRPSTHVMFTFFVFLPCHCPLPLSRPTTHPTLLPCPLRSSLASRDVRLSFWKRWPDSWKGLVLRRTAGQHVDPEDSETEPVPS